MLEMMPARLWREWIAYSNLEPFGETRADLRAGIVAATVANANRDAKKRKRPFGPEDFMPKFEPKAPQSTEEQLQIVEMLNAALGGVDLRG